MPDFDLIDISLLKLDRYNPRLPTRLRGAEEKDILKHLADRTNIVELIVSIGENGFFEGEMIVVTKEGSKDGKYIVHRGKPSADRRNAAE